MSPRRHSRKVLSGGPAKLPGNAHQINNHFKIKIQLQSKHLDSVYYQCKIRSTKSQELRLCIPDLCRTSGLWAQLHQTYFSSMDTVGLVYAFVMKVEYVLAVFTLDIGDSCSVLCSLRGAFCFELVANHNSEDNSILWSRADGHPRKIWYLMFGTMCSVPVCLINFVCV